ncbi:hypothetical protein Hanom_Chr07g00597011 [Helianthus anomalus]
MVMYLYSFSVDSLAQAVADEMQKVYTKELRPTHVPLTVEGGVMMRKMLVSL